MNKNRLLIEVDKELENALTVISERLENDNNYKFFFQHEISFRFSLEFYEYVKRKKIKDLNELQEIDINIISNEAAKSCVNSLIVGCLYK